jgi:hypothetical protein
MYGLLTYFVKYMLVAVFVARASFILRGMGTLLDKQIRTSVRWASQANVVLGDA